MGFAGNRFLPFQGRERILVYGPNRFHFFRRTGDDDDGSLRIPLYSPLSKSTCDQKEDLGRSTLPEILKQRVKSAGWQALGFSCRTQRADEPEVYGTNVWAAQLSGRVAGERLVAASPARWLPLQNEIRARLRRTMTVSFSGRAREVEAEECLGVGVKADLKVGGARLGTGEAFLVHAYAQRLNRA